jgi:hypothetical protein
MFIQVIRGTTNDPAALRARGEDWQATIRPGATGYLGTTMGILDGGAFILLARFESEEAAMRNSERPEQGEWFAETSKIFNGEPTFLNVTDVEPWLDGGSDDAGFVQVMIGHSPDRDALKDRAMQDGDMLRAARPEIIGGLSGVWGDDGYVNVAYFTSEAEARQSEAQGPPPEAADQVNDFQRLLGDVEFIDIKDPILW